MIPKIIHYIWVGNKPMPRIVKKCIRSWHKYCKNYKFVLWNEETFDISKYKYTYEAYQNKNFAYVSDFIRLYALYNYGGIYLDTDMELLKSIDDLLENEAFVGFEDKQYASCGIIGSTKNNFHINNLLKSMIKDSFDLNKEEKKLITIPKRLTSYLNKIGLKNTGETQNIKSFCVYSIDYFYPISFFGDKYFSSQTRSIHHWAGSWISPKENRLFKFRRFLNYHRKLHNFLSSLKRIFIRKK